MESGETADSKAETRLEGPREEAFRIVQVETVGHLPKWRPLKRVKQEPEEGLLALGWEAQWQHFLSAVQSSPPGMGRLQPPEAALRGDTKDRVENPISSSPQASKEQGLQRGEDLQQAPSFLGSREGGEGGTVKGESQHTLSTEEERLQFRRFAYEEAGGPQEAYSQLHKRCHRWLQPERQTKERILDVLILEQFLTVLPREMQVWVTENSPETCAQAVALAERFLSRQRHSERQDEKVLTWIKEETAMSPEAVQTLSETARRRLVREVMQQSGRGAVLPGGDGWVSDCDEEPQGMLLETTPNLELQESFVKEDESKREEGREGFSPRGKPIVDQEGLVCEITFQQRIHKGNGRSLCTLCGKSFSTKSSFNRHQRIHTGEKPYECPDCSESFLARSNLIRHQRIHTGEKPYKCSDCGKKFSRSANLITHRRSHTGEKPYKCSGCGKMFSQSAHLIKHQRTHVREQPYECTNSGKGFSQETTLSGNKRIHHRR